MNKKSTLFAEYAGASYANKNIFSKAFQYYFGPFIKRIKYKLNLMKWAEYSSDVVLPWDWGKTNYSRIAVDNILIDKYQDPSYLEIGCASNTLFDAVPCAKKIGVDPMSGGNMRMTSDAFFQNNKSTFDIVFIDGLHTYEQVRLDIINSIASLRPGGWIALHDMLPRDWIEQHVPLISRGPWTGDVWKVGFELAKTEGIDFKILKIDHGVGVIKVINQDATLCDLGNELREQKFSYLCENLDKLPITSWEDAQNWLRA